MLTNREIAERIKNMCEERGMTQSWLCSQLGLNPSYLSGIANTNRKIGSERLRKIASLLGVSVQSIVGEEEHKTAIEDKRIAVLNTYYTLTEEHQTAVLKYIIELENEETLKAIEL